MSDIDDDSGAAHPSRRALERLAFEPDSAADAPVRAHVAGCPVCAATLADLRAASARFVTERPTAAFMAAVEERAGRPQVRRRFWAAASALVVAAAVLVIVAAPRRDPRPSDAAIHLKGGTSVELRLFVSRHGEDARPFEAADTTLYPGDVLRFAVTVPRDGYAWLFDLDAAGRISRYHPATPGGSAAIGRGRGVLSESIHLDDYLGDELLLLAFSPTPLDAVTVTRALSAAHRAAGGDLARITSLELDASVAFVRIHKERRP